MAYLLLPHRWARQPTAPVRINPAFQDESKVGSLLTPANKFYDLGQRRNATVSGVTIEGVATNQLGYTSTDAAYMESASDADSILHTTECTMLMVEHAATGSYTNYFSNGYDDAGGRVAIAYPYANGALYWDFGNTGDGRLGGISYSALTGRVNVWALIAGATAGRKIWHNGVLLGSNANNATRAATTSPFRWLSAFGGGSASGTHTFLFGILREAWSDAKVREWSRNPWQIFAPQIRRIYVGPAAGGGAIAGTSALVFGAGSTAITGKGALAGSAALAFGASSTATGKGAVAGTAAITFAASGTVAGKGAIAGAAALTFAATGAATGKGALAATSVLTFTVEGALLNAAAGSVAGTSAITFTPTGTLTGKGSLAATGAMAFAGTAGATGKGALTGQADVLFTLAGELDGVAEGSVAGTAAFAFTPTGTLTGKGALAGASAMIFVPTARARAIGIEVYASSGASTQRTKAGRRAQVSGRARSAQTAARRRIN